MKIQHVITTLDVGGAEVHLLSQVKGQVARGHQVRVAYLKGDGALAEDFLAVGAESVSSLGSGPSCISRIARLAKEADIVHSHLLKADAATALAARLRGFRPRLISGKHNDERALLRPWVSRIHGVLGNWPARTIVLSKHVGRFVAQHGRVDPKSMRQVYYGIDRTPFEEAAQKPDPLGVREEFGWPKDAFVMICVARFAAQKAHEVLLQALNAARRDERVGSRMRLLLVGDDPFGEGKRKAEDEASRLELGTLVQFAGIRRDVPRLMAASDLFVMASRWEGLGLVFLEAMASGVPVVSTDVSAIPEVVLDGETGRLVPKDDPGRLAAGMLEAALDPELCARWAKAGALRVASDFGLDRMVDETLAIYEEVLAGQGA